MSYWLEPMKQRLSSEDEAFLKKIYEPTVVTIPPNQACRNMCVTPDGEIRIYGAIDKSEPNDIGCQVVSVSNDCGLSWKTRLMKKGVLGAATYNKETGRYITTYPNEYRPDLDLIYDKQGTYAVIGNSFDDEEAKLVKLTDDKVHFLKLPMYLESRKRWLVFGEYTLPDYSDRQVALFYSDDDGESWNGGIIGKSAPKHELQPPHKSVRWQQYSCEPTVVELENGELVMFVRTSQDHHYSYRSLDGGETWEGPTVTELHGTITMPVLQKLSDGRIVFFWCNTQPLPEIDHKNDFPKLHPTEESGMWEDVFTNRDANHLAISEDGMKTWIGFRELFLNDIRNNSDFRSIGGANSRDKSVHQGQILELPYNKLLIHFGQNTVSQKVVIVDIDWLYQKTRFENFRTGLTTVSTQMYIKSNLGGYKGFSGHCSYNRTNGALLLPDPSGNFREVLCVGYVDDDRLVYKKQGVVWNFPALKKGRTEIVLSVVGSGVRISLTDRWFNPCDETIDEYAAICYDVKEKCPFLTVAVEYDTEKKLAKLYIGEKHVDLEFKTSAPNGISYLHIQTLATKKDLEGTLLRSLKSDELK